MKKIISLLMLFFYVAIILYIFFAVLKVDTLENFVSALVFEIIGFLAVACFILCNVFTKSIKVGYFVPLVMTTVIYTIVLDAVNMVCITTVSGVIFTLVHLLILFVYCLISIPMYLMGRK